LLVKDSTGKRIIIELQYKDEADYFHRMAFGVSKLIAASINEIFPTFYILRINDFDDLPKDGLDQWIYFLKNEALPENITAKGLKEAQDKLDIMKLSTAERSAYDEYQEQLRIEASEIEFRKCLMDKLKESQI
jgi:hypothetical protein